MYAHKLRFLFCKWSHQVLHALAFCTISTFIVMINHYNTFHIILEWANHNEYFWYFKYILMLILYIYLTTCKHFKVLYFCNYMSCYFYYSIPLQFRGKYCTFIMHYVYLINQNIEIDKPKYLLLKNTHTHLVKVLRQFVFWTEKAGYAFPIHHRNHHQSHCHRRDDKRHHGCHPRSLFICKRSRETQLGLARF